MKFFFPLKCGHVHVETSHIGAWAVYVPGPNDHKDVRGCWVCKK
jgi:hypothetical protein